MDEKSILDKLNFLVEQTNAHRAEFRVFRDQFLNTRHDLWEKSRERWRRDEADISLTWGARWTGDAFVDLVSAHYSFTSDTRILEVGPGYGRLLDTILQRGLPFSGYLGIDLSEARVCRLRKKYEKDTRINLVVADVEKFTCDLVDLVISSATFSHLFPNFIAAMTNIRRQLVMNGTVCFDVSEGSIGGFQDDGMTFGRSYEKGELRTIFSGSNFGEIHIDRVEHGVDAVTKEAVKMLFVSCKRLR